MAKKNHLMLAAMSVLQHAAEMCDDARSHKAIRKYLKQGVGMVKQAAAHDSTEVADSEKPAKGSKGTPGRKPLAERLSEAHAGDTGQVNGPTVPPIKATEDKKPGIFGR